LLSPEAIIADPSVALLLLILVYRKAKATGIILRVYKESY